MFVGVAREEELCRKHLSVGFEWECLCFAVEVSFWGHAGVASGGAEGCVLDRLKFKEVGI